MKRDTQCAVCGEPRILDEGWFLLAANRWTDRLKILAYSPMLVLQEGFYPVCCRAHVRELVVHWMTTGRLDHPFAQVPGKKRLPWRGIKPSASTPLDPDCHDFPLYGELAVHRESLARVLREDPQALGPVLEALVMALAPRRSPAGTPPEPSEIPSAELLLTEA